MISTVRNKQKKRIKSAMEGATLDRMVREDVPQEGTYALHEMSESDKAMLEGINKLVMVFLDYLLFWEFLVICKIISIDGNLLS